MPMKKQPHYLGIDRWSKYIGLAYSEQGQELIFPLGYVLNDSMTLYSIADYVTRYNVRTIVIGYPAKQEDVQEKINRFIKSLAMTIDAEKVNIEKVEEDYTSVESGEILSNFKKNAAEDTVSAMLILQRWKQLHGNW